MKVCRCLLFKEMLFVLNIPQCLLAAAFVPAKDTAAAGKNGEFVEAAVWSHRSC